MPCDHTVILVTTTVRPHPLAHGPTTPGVMQLDVSGVCEACAAPLTFSLPPTIDIAYQEAAMLPGGQTARLSARVLAAVQEPGV